MKKSIILLGLVFIAASCSDLDKEPPIQGGNMDKEYKLPDPTPLTPSQREEYNRRNAEYHNNVNN